MGLSLPYTHLYRFFGKPCFSGKIVIFSFSRGASSLWEENKERLALAKRFGRRPFGDFGLGNWEQEPRPHLRPGHAGGASAVVAILPHLHHHPPPVWTHIPWIDQRAHFDGSEGVFREEQEERKVRKRGSREGRLRRKGAKGDLSELSEGEGVRRSVSLHSRAGRERRQKVTLKVI